MEYQLDYLDREILTALTENARIPFTQLAQKLKISNSLVHQRMKKLVAADILAEPVYRVNAERLGYETCAYIQLSLTHGKFLEAMIEALRKIPEIVECANIAGSHDLLLKIYTRNNSHLQDILYQNIHQIPGVENTNTVIAFETAFNRGVPILNGKKD